MLLNRYNWTDEPAFVQSVSSIRIPLTLPLSSKLTSVTYPIRMPSYWFGYGFVVLVVILGKVVVVAFFSASATLESINYCTSLLCSYEIMFVVK